MVKLGNITKRDDELMKLVLLFFCVFLGFIFLILLLLLSSSIKLNIKKFNISNFENGRKKEKIEKDIEVYLELHLFGIIKIAKIKIDEKLFKELKMTNNLKDIKKDWNILKQSKTLNIIKKLKIKLRKTNIDLEIGTEDAILTAFLVTVISSIIGIALHSSNYKETYFNIVPLYYFGNSVNLKLKSIINVKVVHIIYVIYIFLKKGRIKNERTSNRRSYDYSYE